MGYPRRLNKMIHTPSADGGGKPPFLTLKYSSEFSNLKNFLVAYKCPLLYLCAKDLRAKLSTPKRRSLMFRTPDCSLRRISFTLASGFLLILCATSLHAQVLGDPVDVGQDFMKMENVYFVGNSVKSFDPATGAGTLQWDRYLRGTTLSFNKIDVSLSPGKATEFPGSEYDQNPVLPFSITFVSPRTIRLRMSTRAVPLNDGQSMMLAGPVPSDNSCKM